MPQNFEEHPVEVFRRNVYVNPFWEDDVEDLVDLIPSSTCSSAPTTRIPRGSQNRSTTSTTSPSTRASTTAATRRIMSENANDLLGLSIAA